MRYLWYIAPSVNAAGFYNGQSALATGLTVGHYVGPKNNARIDLHGDYYRFDKNVGAMSTSALVSGEIPDEVFGIKRLYYVGSVGLGLLFPVYSGAVKGDRYVDMLIPLKYSVEYRFTNSFFIGVEATMVANLFHPKARCISKIGFNTGVRF